MNKLLKSVFSLAMALALIFSLGTAAFAAEYDIDLGSITVTATDSGQTVSQNGTTSSQEQSTVIKSSTGNSTANCVRIETKSETATANVTLSGVNIDTTTESGSKAALTVTGDGTVNIELEGNNSLTSSGSNAGLQKYGDGSLNINDADNDGSLIATGSGGGAGIGGSGSGADAKNISINGGTVTAIGSSEITNDDEYNQSIVGAPGIGGGANKSCCGDAYNININGGTVTAIGGYGAAGIGGGASLSVTDIGDGDYYLGSDFGNCENVTISGNANVTAQGGGSDSVTSNNTEYKLAEGTAIGKGANGATPGEIVTPKTSDFTGTLLLKNAAGDILEGSILPAAQPGDTADSSSVSVPAASSPLSARYSVTVGNNQTWLTGSDDGLEFTLNSENVIKVLVDGEEVEFELNDNGNIVISAEILQLLEAGEHEIEFVFADGSCKTVFTVK